MAAIEGVSSRRTLEVIAEGVETVAMRALLEQNGCHACQGCLFGRPVGVEEFEEWLRGGREGKRRPQRPRRDNT